MAKGSDRERQAVEILQRAGYATYRPATVRFGENDPWGLFDVLAFHVALPPRFVQVKSNRPTGLADWKRHTQLWRAHGILTEYWVPHDREGWTIYDAGQEPSDGRRAARVVYDEREDQDVTPHRGTDMGPGDGVVRWLTE